MAAFYHQLAAPQLARAAPPRRGLTFFTPPLRLLPFRSTARQAGLDVEVACRNLEDAKRALDQATTICARSRRPLIGDIEIISAFR